MDETRSVACFLRVDLAVAGAHDPARYAALSERLQDLLQDAVLEPDDGEPPLDLENMTCVVVGPLEDDESLGEAETHEEAFAPLLDLLDEDDDEDDDVVLIDDDDDEDDEDEDDPDEV